MVQLLVNQENCNDDNSVVLLVEAGANKLGKDTYQSYTVSITSSSFYYVLSAFSDLTTFSTSTVLSSLSLLMLSSTALIMSNDSFRNIDKRLLLIVIVC